MRLGFVGLGIMGSRMAANLLTAGYALTVYNRSVDKTTPLADAGQVVQDAPASLEKIREYLAFFNATASEGRKEGTVQGTDENSVRRHVSWKAVDKGDAVVNITQLRADPTVVPGLVLGLHHLPCPD